MKRALWLLCLIATACREPERYVAPDPFDSIGSNDAGRLTWNVHEDHSAAWSGSSDSLYYTARSYPGFPATGGLLLTVPRTPGRAKLILESLQRAVAPQPWLTAAALSPNKRTLAFVELTEVYDPRITCNAGIECGLGRLSPIDTSNANTPLVRGRIRVRPLDGGSEQTLPIVFEGKQGDTRIAHPFQRQFERDRAEVFRPSWSPDGTRLVFSDGLRLFVWSVGSNAATPIPGTNDGVWPAWNPAGDIIAFTQLRRDGSHTVTCGCYRAGRVVPVERHTRVIYHDGNARVGNLVLIRPDGTQRRVIGEGEAPAWTPDGQSLVFQRDLQLYRSAADGSNATVIPNTDLGFEPAISPNGRWLAFTRFMGEAPIAGDANLNRKDYNLWVVGF